MSNIRAIPVTISAAADGLSNAIDLEDQFIAGLTVSAAWTAAAITFLLSTSLNGTYYSIFDEGAEISIASANVVAGRTILFADALNKKLRAVRFLKIRSGIQNTAVQQAAPRIISILAADQ